MGLLDDAIREHLELKRRHGAPEGEVTRLETEVFGPAGAPAPAEPEAAAEVSEQAPAEEPAEQPARPEPPAEQPARPEPSEAPAPRAVEPAPTAEEARPVEDPEPPHGDALEEVVQDQPARFAADDPWLDDPDEVPADERLDHPRRQPTTEFTPEDHASARGEAGFVEPDDEPGEDLLEETPEFLQETPEHDRLWFEQKPPKDFDFGS